MSYEILSYKDQIQAAADLGDVDIKAAIVAGGHNDSVYYRLRNGQCDLSLRVAVSIMKSIERLAIVPHDPDASTS